MPTTTFSTSPELLRRLCEVIDGAESNGLRAIIMAPDSMLSGDTMPLSVDDHFLTLENYKELHRLLGKEPCRKDLYESVFAWLTITQRTNIYYVVGQMQATNKKAMKQSRNARPIRKGYVTTSAAISTLIELGITKLQELSANVESTDDKLASVDAGGPAQKQANRRARKTVATRTAA